ncbi:heterokaryon incompatibility protein-domain-containing protein [Ilyonectria destructans]|nr:heterokaryon incompatibility protein-domain-containing protein [Ilyonectria destructans]
MDGLHYTDDVGTSSMRLVKISVEPDESRIIPSLTVSTHLLVDLPVYFALSYTWGPPSVGNVEYGNVDKVPILLNGKRLRVNPNLHDALLQLYHLYPSVPLWIDAICIDQENRAEREAQVGIMDQIYRRANKVIIWLGKITDRDQVQRGAGLVKQLAQVATREVLGIIQAQDFGLGIDITNPESLKRFSLPVLTQQDAEALISFYRSRWFHRIWILQEVALAKEAEVLWGNISVPWDDIGMVAVFLQLTSMAAGLSFHFLGDGFNVTEVDVVGQGFLGAMRIQLVREWCKGPDSPLHGVLDLIEFMPGVSGTSMSILLLQLVLWTRVSFQASDRRDCVYGFQGILNHMFNGEKIPTRLQADYGVPTEEVMLRFTIEVLEATQSLHVLGLVCDPALRQVPGTPSWVPDLSPVAAANPMLGPCFKSMVAGDSLFHASTKTIGHQSSVFRINGRKLHVHGQRVGTVRMTGEELDEAFQGNLHGWAELMLAMEPVYMPTRQPRSDAFRRAIVLDQDESRRRALPEALLKLNQAITWVIFLAAQKVFDGQTPAAIEEFLAERHLVFRAAEEVQDCFFPTREVVEECCGKYGMLPETDGLHGEEKQRWLKNFHAEAFSGAGLLLAEALGHRRPFMLENGYIGSGPKSTNKGNEVWILSGCRTPLVLRKLEGRREYSLIGEAYVHGIMHGEFVEEEGLWESLCLV